MATTTQNTMSFNRWTRGSMDRIYVSGLGGVHKVWLEEADGDAFRIRTNRPHTANDDLFAVECNEIYEELEAIFGHQPAWSEMVEAC